MGQPWSKKAQCSLMEVREEECRIVRVIFTDDDLYHFFCLQLFLVTSTKYIYYTIPYDEFVIWRLKIFVINYNQ